MKTTKSPYASALRSVAQILMFAGALTVTTVVVGAEQACATVKSDVQDKTVGAEREIMLQLHRLGMPVPVAGAPKS